MRVNVSHALVRLYMFGSAFRVPCFLFPSYIIQYPCLCQCKNYCHGRTLNCIVIDVCQRTGGTCRYLRIGSFEKLMEALEISYEYLSLL
jgi:hypothetical protein